MDARAVIAAVEFDDRRCYNAGMNKPLSAKTSKIVKIGNSAGIILSKNMLAQLGVALGDSISLIDTEQGVELRAFQPDLEQQMAVARKVMARRVNALRELAR